MRKFGMFSAWLLVTLLVTGLTWQIVSAADDRVSDSPVIGITLDPGLVSTTTSLATETSTPDSSPTTAVGQTTSSGPTGSAPSSTSPGGSVGSTSTTSGSSSSTAPSGEWKVASVPTIGGTVVVSYRDDEVKLNSVNAAPGFTASVDRAGPPEVRVDFEGVSTTVEVRIDSDDGVLDIEVDES